MKGTREARREIEAQYEPFEAVYKGKRLECPCGWVTELFDFDSDGSKMYRQYHRHVLRDHVNREIEQ